MKDQYKGKILKDLLEHSLLRATEMSHVETFRGYRKHKDGETREIWIEIHDAGPDVDLPNNRYRVFAYDEDGRVMCSNSDESIEFAIASAQWDRFDRDDYIDPAYVRPKQYPATTPNKPVKKAAPKKSPSPRSRRR